MNELYAQFLREKQNLCNFSFRYIKLFRWVLNRWDALIGQPPDKQNVKEWVIKLTQTGISPIIVNTYVRAYNSFLTWLYEKGHNGGASPDQEDQGGKCPHPPAVWVMGCHRGVARAAEGLSAGGVVS